MNLGSSIEELREWLNERKEYVRALPEKEFSNFFEERLRRLMLLEDEL